jgi:hypothetical protein
LANFRFCFSPVRARAEIKAIRDLGTLGGHRGFLAGDIGLRPDAIWAFVQKHLGPAAIRPADLGNLQIGHFAKLFGEIVAVVFRLRRELQRSGIRPFVGFVPAQSLRQHQRLLILKTLFGLKSFIDLQL